MQRLWAGLCQTGAPSPVDPPSASAADVSCSSLLSLFVSPRSALFTLHSAPDRHVHTGIPTAPLGTLFPLCVACTRRVSCLAVSDGSGACVRLVWLWCGDVLRLRLGASVRCSAPVLVSRRLRSRSALATALAPAAETARAEAAARLARLATAAVVQAARTTSLALTTPAPAQAVETAPATTTTRTAPSRTDAASSDTGTSRCPHRNSHIFDWCVRALSSPLPLRSVFSSMPLSTPAPHQLPSHTSMCTWLPPVSYLHSPSFATLCSFPLRSCTRRSLLHPTSRPSVLAFALRHISVPQYPSYLAFTRPPPRPLPPITSLTPGRTTPRPFVRLHSHLRTHPAFCRILRCVFPPPLLSLPVRDLCIPCLACSTRLPGRSSPSPLFSLPACPLACLLARLPTRPLPSL